MKNPDLAGYCSFLFGESVGSTGYLMGPSRDVIGRATVKAVWATPRSFVSSHYLQVEVKVGGLTYTGRSAGNGMLWQGKLTAASRRAVERCEPQGRAS